MIQNRMSPKKPLIAAFCVALVCLSYAAGYRGKYRPDAPPFSPGDTARYFVKVLSVSFIIFYPLRMLGVHMGAGGGRESPDPKPKPVGKKPKRADANVYKTPRRN